MFRLKRKKKPTAIDLKRAFIDAEKRAEATVRKPVKKKNRISLGTMLSRKKKNREQTENLKKKDSFPWVLFILLLISIYVFWILPEQLSHLPVEVIFLEDK